MSNQTDNFIANIQIISDEVRETFGKLSAEQINWKPSESEWSVGQCFDHLIVTNELYFKPIQRVADGTHQNNFFSKIPFFSATVGKMLKKFVSPDNTKKVKNPPVFSPSSSEISQTIIEDFCANQEKVISFLEAVKNLETHKIKIPTPISEAVNISLNDAFEVLVMHERRHFNQAKRVMDSDGFPK